MTPAALLAARILLGLLFVMAGFGKLGDVAGFAGDMASGGVPAFLAWPVVRFEIPGGLALILGLQTLWVALALGAFCILSGVLCHFAPADRRQITQILKNLGLVGGYLARGGTRPGALSVDAGMGCAATLAA